MTLPQVISDCIPILRPVILADQRKAHVKPQLCNFSEEKIDRVFHVITDRPPKMNEIIFFICSN